MGDILSNLFKETIIEWLYIDYHWVILIILAFCFGVYWLVKNYFNYNLKETLHSAIFWFVESLILILSGIIISLLLFKFEFHFILAWGLVLVGLFSCGILIYRAQASIKLLFGCIFIFLVLVIIGFKTYNLFESGFWFVITKTSLQMNSPRLVHLSVELQDGRVLILGGVLGGYRLKGGEILEPDNLKFTPVDDTNNEASYNGAILLKTGKVLVVGGSDRNVEMFDQETNRFTQSRSKTIYQHGSFLSLTLLNDGGVLIIEPGGNRTTTEVYDPINDRFSPSFDLIVKSRTGHTATLLKDETLTDNRILVAGGSLSGPTGPYAKTAEIINLKTGPVLSRDLSEARINHTANILPSGKVLIIGGRGVDFNNVPLSSAEFFDPGLGYFRLVAHMKVPRWGHTATLLRDRSVVVIGGFTEESDTPTDIIERFYTVNGHDEFKIIGRLRNARAYHTTTLLKDGKTLLIAGGIKGYEDFKETQKPLTLNTAEILSIDY